MATNKVYESGKVLPIAVASTIESGDPVVLGQLGGGVALTSYDSVDGKATVDFGGVYDLSVKGADGAGSVAVAVGDALYYVAADTPKLSKKTSGVFFGNALEAVVSGETTTIQVRSAAGTAGANNGVFMSGETTATGSSQSVAHGLGVIPGAIMVSPTEFVSGSNYDVAEGTHTTANVVLTVLPAGAKFKVLAIR